MRTLTVPAVSLQAIPVLISFSLFFLLLFRSRQSKKVSMNAWRRRNEAWNNKRKKSEKEIKTGIACKETAGTVNVLIEGSGCNCRLE